MSKQDEGQQKSALILASCSKDCYTNAKTKTNVNVLIFMVTIVRGLNF